MSSQVSCYKGTNCTNEDCKFKHSQGREFIFSQEDFTRAEANLNEKALKKWFPSRYQNNEEYQKFKECYYNEIRCAATSTDENSDISNHELRGENVEFIDMLKHTLKRKGNILIWKK